MVGCGRRCAADDTPIKLPRTTAMSLACTTQAQRRRNTDAPHAPFLSGKHASIPARLLFVITSSAGGR